MLFAEGLVTCPVVCGGARNLLGQLARLDTREELLALVAERRETEPLLKLTNFMLLRVEPELEPFCSAAARPGAWQQRLPASALWAGV